MARAEASPEPYKGPHNIIERLEAISPAEVWVINGNLMHTTDSGVSWESSRFEKVIVRSIHFLDRDTGYFVGQLLRVPSRANAVETWHQIIYGTNNAGRDWRVLFVGPNERYPLWDVWATSRENVWAVGSPSLHSTDGGATWNKVRVDSGPEVSGMPSQVRFADAAVGWMKTTEGGGFLLTTDAGKTWEPRSDFWMKNGVADVVYATPTQAWAAGHGIYHSRDGGITWIKQVEGDFWRLHYVRSAKHDIRGRESYCSM